MPHPLARWSYQVFRRRRTGPRGSTAYRPDCAPPFRHSSRMLVLPTTGGACSERRLTAKVAPPSNDLLTCERLITLADLYILMSTGGDVSPVTLV